VCWGFAGGQDTTSTIVLLTLGPLLITVPLTAYGATGWALLGLVVAVAGMMIHLIVRNARTVALEES